MNAKKILMGLMLVMIFCGTSQADIVYTTSTGNLGLFTISRNDDTLTITSPVLQYSGVGTNSLAASYWDGSNARLIVIDRTTDLTASSGDTALIFSTGNLTEPLNTEKTTLTGAYNVQSVINSYNGRGLFAASRENASFIEFYTKDFSVGHSYVYEPESGDTEAAKAVNIIADIKNLYVLLNVGASKSLAMKFDGQLKKDIEGYVRVENDYAASLMGWLSNGRIAAAHSNGVDVLESGHFRRLMSFDVPVKTFCMDSGNGFYFEAQSGDVCGLYHYDHESADVTPLRENMTGTRLQTLRDESNNVLAAIIGGKILFYDMLNDTLAGEYDSSALNGEPVSLAVPSASGDDGKRSSGCNLSGAGIILLSACVYCLKSKRR